MLRLLPRCRHVCATGPSFSGAIQPVLLFQRWAFRPVHLERRCFGDVATVLGRLVRFTRTSIKKKSTTTTNVSNPAPKAAMTDIKRLLALAGPEKYRLTGGILLLAVSSGVTMSVPFFIGRIIDMIFKDESASAASNDERSKIRMERVHATMEKLSHFCYILVGIFVIGAAANFGRVYLMHTAGALVINRLRTRVFSSIVRQEIAFFDKTKTGELVNRLSNDASLVGYATTINISDGLRSVAAGIGGAGMMWYTSPTLSIIGFAIVPPVALIAVGYGRFLRKLTKRLNDALADATQVAEERISNIRTVRAFCAEELEEKTYTRKVGSVMGLAYNEAYARAGFFGSAGLSGNLIMLAILYKGGQLVASGQISIGDLSSFLLYAIYVGTSISGLGSFYSELMRGLGASERLFELLHRKPTIPHGGGIYIPRTDFMGNIEFNKVTFSYPGREKVDVLNDFQLQVPSGSVTAIVGPSGSGKSTIAALLLRYYDPIRGSVKVDGKDIRNLDAICLRNYIGTVNQEPALFSCSIKENIAYGAAMNCTAVPMDDVLEAAKQANAYEFIMRLPQQFDTVVGERGVLLSGGQRQRIAIARALLKKPKILLMDEATSALDAESEHLVKQALDRLFHQSDCTVLVIAHRLSTIRNADQIAVLEGGKVVELGTYDILFSIPNGVFRKLVEKQTAGSLSNVKDSELESDNIISRL